MVCQTLFNGMLEVGIDLIDAVLLGLIWPSSSIELVILKFFSSSCGLVARLRGFLLSRSNAAHTRKT